jgi:F-type H+-transporting ATPase subunit b
VNINLTLVIQMIVFAILIWFTMRFVWPMILGPLEERQRKIATGLAAADQGRKDLADAQANAEQLVREARERASQIIDQAQRRANEMIEHAKSQAGVEGQRVVAAASARAEQEASSVRESLRKDVARIAVLAASKVLGREVDAKAHADLLSKLALDIRADR